MMWRIASGAVARTRERPAARSVTTGSVQTTRWERAIKRCDAGPEVPGSRRFHSKPSLAWGALHRYAPGCSAVSKARSFLENVGAIR